MTAAAPRTGRGWMLGAAVSVGLVLYFALQIEWSDVRRTLRTADGSLVGAAFAVLALVPLVSAERWRNACIATGISLARSFFFRATYAAQFAGQFLPPTVGMDAVRLATLWRQNVPLAASVKSIAVDRACGLAAILIVMYAGLPFAVGLLPAGAAGPVIVATAAVAAAGGALLFLDRLPLPATLFRGSVGRVAALIADVRRGLASAHAALALLYGIAIHGLMIFGVLLLARAFGYVLAYVDLLTVTAVAIFATMLPISANGWGVREGAMVVGLSLLDVPRDAALTISVLYGIGGTLVSLPGSVAWYRLRHVQETPR
jgi:uncharacterized membrane protein YbhN (UPF0104 family)